MALDLTTRPRRDGPLTIAPVVVGECSPDEQVERAAAATKVRAILEALGLEEYEDELAGLMEATSLEEGAYWNPEKHPRWPKGTPLAGKFMEVGQRFELNGVEYDVEAVLPGKLHARVATKGSTQGAKTVDLTDAQLAGAKRPAAEPIHAATKAATKSGHAGTATVIDPYADPKTHDSSIAIPDAAKAHMTPDAWKRFGKLDQERYSQLMERYGTWSPGKSQTLINSAMKSAHDKKVLAIVTGGYSSQKGSSTGLTLSMHQVFSNVVKSLKGTGHAEAARDDFEKARALQAEIASAIQWDLYNRARSPDVALFHKHSDHSLFGKVQAGQLPVFSGLSMSQHYRHGWWSDGCFATPMAIRHVVMSTISGDVTSGYSHEEEVAVADPFITQPGRSLNWSDSGFAQGKAKWLEAQTSQAASGEILEMLHKANTDPSYELPIPPSPPIIQMDGAGGKQHKEPPPLVHDVVKKWGTKQNAAGETVLNVKWAKETGGAVEPKEANQLRLQAGDFIMGNPKSPDKGTVYVIVEDPSDSYMGLAYYKLTEPDGVTPDGSGQAFHFEGGGTTKFKKIDAHFDIAGYEKAQASKSGEKAPFNPKAWTETVDKKFTNQLPPGTKFSVHGNPYEVLDGGKGQPHVKIKSLETGLPGKINGDYKTPWLQLKPGYTEEGTVAFDPTQFFAPGEQGPLGTLGAQQGDVVKSGGTHYEVLSIGAANAELKKLEGANVGQVSQVPLGSLTGALVRPKPLGWTDPQPGDTLAVGGKKAVVTKVLKDGTVQINLKPGVLKVQPDDAVLAGIFSPQAHDLGDKTKLKNMSAGAKFHAGSGAQLRPYVVVGPGEKGKTKVVNLDTGEESQLSSLKSFKLLVPKAAEVSGDPDLGHLVPSSPGAIDPANYEFSHDAKVSDLQTGDVFSKNGVLYSVEHTDEKGLAKNLADGSTIPIGMNIAGAATAGVSIYKPKGAALTEMKDLEVGDHILHDGKVYVVSEKTVTGGGTAIPVGGAESEKLVSHPNWPYVKVPAPASAGTLPSVGQTVTWLSIDGTTKSGEVLGYSDNGVNVKVSNPDGGFNVVAASKLSAATPAGAGTTPFHSIPQGAYFQAPGPDGEPQGPQFLKLDDSKVRNLATGDEMNIGADNPFEYHVIDVPDSPGAQPATAFSEIPVGGKFEAHGAVWEKTAEGGVITEIIPGHGQGAPVGYVEPNFGPDDVVTPIVGAPEAAPEVGPADLTKNEDKKSFAELGLKVGDKVAFSTFASNILTVTDVYGEPGTQGHVYDTVDPEGNPATWGTGGTPKAYWKAAPDHELAPQGPPPELPATAYDPSAYAPGGKKTLGDLAVGDVFVGAKNGKHYMVTKTGAKSGLSALDLLTGKVSTPWKYDKTAETMQPKAHGAVDLENLKPGDPVTLGALKVGDHVQLSPGGTAQVFEIVGKGEGEAPQVTLSPVGADYTLGAPGTANTHPLAQVTFHQHAAQVAAEKAQLAQALQAGTVTAPHDVDVGALPSAHDVGLVAFSPKSKTGGGYFFTKAKLAGPDTLLQGKDGQVWKVKQAGAQTVLTDGTAHYSVDGEANLKVVEQPFDDQSPPLAGASLQDTQAALAEAQQVDLGGPQPLHALGLEQGDTFTSFAKSGKHAGTWEVTSSHEAGEQTPEFLTAFNPKTGATQTFGSHFAATSYGKGFSGYKPGDDVVPSKLKVGDHVKAKSGEVYAVEQHAGLAVGGVPGAQVALRSLSDNTIYPAAWFSDHPKEGAAGWTYVSPTAPQGFDAAAYEPGGQVSAAALKDGDVFQSPATGMTYKIVGETESLSAPAWKVLRPDGTEGTWSKDFAGDVVRMNPVGTTDSPPTHDDLTDGQAELGKVPVGTYVSTSDPTSAIWKVVGKEGYEVHVELAVPNGNLPDALPVGHQEKFGVGSTFEKSKLPDGAAAPKTTEVHNLPAGAWFSDGNEDVWKVYETSGPEVGVVATSADGSETVAFPPQYVVQPLDGPPAAAGKQERSWSLYVPDKLDPEPGNWEHAHASGEVGELPPGTVFQPPASWNYTVPMFVASKDVASGEMVVYPINEPSEAFNVPFGQFGMKADVLKHAGPPPGSDHLFAKNGKGDTGGPSDDPSALEVGHFATGSYVKGTGGTLFKVTGHFGGKTTIMAVSDVQQGDAFSHSGKLVAGSELEVSSKWKPAEWGWKPGGPIMLNDLAPGDLYEDPYGEKYSVVAHTDAGVEVIPVGLDPQGDEEAIEVVPGDVFIAPLEFGGVPVGAPPPAAGESVNGTQLKVGQWYVDQQDGSTFQVAGDAGDSWQIDTPEGGDFISKFDDEFYTVARDPEGAEPEPAATGASSDVGDYADAGKTTLEALQPGDFFKSIYGSVFQVKQHSKQSGGVSTVVNVATGQENDAHGITPVTALKPLGSHDPAGDGSATAPHGFEQNQAGMSAMQLGVGGKFAGSDGSVHELTDTAADGFQTQIVEHPSLPNAVGTTGWVSADHVPPFVPAGSAPKPHGGPVPDVSAFSEGDFVWVTDFDGTPFHGEVVGVNPGQPFPIEVKVAYPPAWKNEHGLPPLNPASFSIGGEPGSVSHRPLAPSGTTVLPPNVAGAPIGSLAPGDHVQTPAGSIFKVTGKQPSGVVKAELVHGVPGDPLSGAHDFGATWEPAGYVPGELPAGLKQGKQPGDPVVPSELHAGDKVKTGQGNVYEIVDVKQTANGDTEVTQKLLKLATPGGSEVGTTYVDVFGDDVKTWTIADDGDIVPLDGSGGDGPMGSSPYQLGDLKPYSPKSQTGGGYKFGTLGQIAPGTKFTDKSGETFEKVGSHGGAHVYKDAKGNQLHADGASKVKIVDESPQTQAVAPTETLAKVPDDPSTLPFHSLDDLGMVTSPSPYTEDGQLVGVRLIDMKPGETFDIEGDEAVFVGIKNGWAVYEANGILMKSGDLHGYVRFLS